MNTPFPVAAWSEPLRRIEGQQKAKGIRIAFEDLLIGATALHLGYAVATFNLRHLQNIPGLSVIQS
ncbi:MAG: hypothetical protein LAO78_10340 [Acidobacteriia bacterium]|nr:hypothetical protein [Terriglobia bacterium]